MSDRTRYFALLLALLPFAAAAQPPDAAPPAAPPPEPEVRYTFLLSGKTAGFQTLEKTGQHSWEAHFEFDDRGRGPSETTRYTVAAGNLPVLLEVEGKDYFKNPIAERFTLEGGRASWKSAGESGSAAPAGPAFYVPMESAPEMLALLARALLAAPGGRLALLPAGEASVSRLGPLEIRSGDRSRTVQQIAIEGLAFAPIRLWLDSDGTLFASHDGWSTTILEGWESALPQLVAAQDAAAGEREKALVERLGRRPARGFAVTGARLFDARTGTMQPHTTVVVAGDRIAAVGADGEVAIPPGSEVIAAQGKALLPGLWDLHTHLSPDDGILHLAAGVTSVRDLANDTDLLLGLRKRWDEGAAIGPRVVMAGFLDGPGPYAGPTKVLVSTVDEVNAAIDRYAELGYEQIKVYSSIKPELVPAIVARAKRHGLRVSGHVPAFMTAEQAVRAGFDEIQHVNFLFLNFLFDQVQDTRTPARFTAVAEHAAELDLGSERVRSFLALLKEKGVAVDPTVVAFEGMFIGRPGQLSPTFAAVADRLPPQVRRGLLAGGGLPVPEGMDQRYRDSFRALQSMVKALYDAGIPIEAGTDSLAGFAYHRELELYAAAGIPAPEILRIATLNAATLLKHDKDRGSIAPGKLADLILVDGDPATKISDIRRVTTVVKGGTIYDAGELYRAVGVQPAVR